MHRLPSPELSHAYTIAMHFAQELELNLRAFLYIADYHAFIDVPLTEDQRKRYKTFDGFIDNSTCGSLVEKLRAAIVIKNKKLLFAVFSKACEHRNRLAHSFLTEHDFDRMSAEDEGSIIRELRAISADIYKGLLVSRVIRDRVERDSDAAHESLKKTMAFLGLPDYDDAKRMYTGARKRLPKRS